MADQMSIREAELLLGLNPPYTKADVDAAHRAAIRDNHPDVLAHRGVSPEEAKERAIRVNAAKMALLDGLNGASAQSDSSAGAGTRSSAGARSGAGAKASANAGATYSRPASSWFRPEQERSQASSRQASAASAAAGAGAASQTPAGTARTSARERARMNPDAVKWVILSYVLVTYSVFALFGMAYALYQTRVLLLNVTYWGILTDPPLMILCWVGTMVFGWLAKRANEGELPTSSRVARWLAFASFACMNALFFVPSEFLAALF